MKKYICPYTNATLYVCFTGRVFLEKEGIKVLRTERINKDGYCYVEIRYKNKRKNYLIHRLVAFCYLPNPFNKETVNHKDGNKQNNYKGNLEWATRKRTNASCS